MAAPPSCSRPTPALYALTGLAVLGTAWGSALAIALPPQAVVNPAVSGVDHAADRLVWLFTIVFADDTFRLMLAMLFGAGCLRVLGENGQVPARFYAGLGLLLLFGTVHSVILTETDFLRAFAASGLALPILARMNSPALYAVAIGFVGVHTGGGMVVFGSSVVDYYAGRIGTDAALLVERHYGHDAAALEHSLEIGRLGFREYIIARLDSIGPQFRSVLATLPITLAAMALGMALSKDRMFAREWRMFRLQRLAAISGAIALAGLFALAFWASQEGFPAPIVGAAALVLSAPFDLLLALSYAALGMAFFGGRGRIVSGLAAVGQLPLTNYLLTSAVLSIVFASWGLGLFGTLSRTHCAIISLIPAAAMLLWSPLWLRCIQFGPLEWLWCKASRWNA